MTEWISVKEKLPKETGDYLTFILRPDGRGEPKREYRVLYWGGHGYDERWSCRDAIVIHRMPLPDPPKEGF